MFYAKIEYADLLPDAIKSNKVVHFTGGPISNLFGFYEKIASMLGEFVYMDEDLVTGNKNGSKWTNIVYDPKVKDSYRHSCTGQPLHTDGSYEAHAPNISFFFCLNARQDGGNTIFIDSTVIYNLLLTREPELLEQLKKPMKFFKGNDSKTKPVISSDDKGFVLNWNYYRVDKTETTERFKVFLDKVVESGLCLSVKLDPGDALFFQDERLLHGRTPFFAQSYGDRWLVKGGLNVRL